MGGGEAKQGNAKHTMMPSVALWNVDFWLMWFVLSKNLHAKKEVLVSTVY